MAIANPKGGAALITGGSSGIGYALAECFARDGHKLILCADKREKLEAAAEKLRGVGAASVHAITADLSKAGGAPELHGEVEALGWQVDYLVNNAGAGVHGDFVRETDLARELAVIQLNCAAVVQLTKLFAKPMVERGHGRILIVSSVVAQAPSPLQAVYSATKAFDYNFAEAVANELKETGVTVTALQPDATETDFFKSAGAADTEIGRAKKADPADIAKAGYAAMMRGADHVVAPFSARVRQAFVNVLPARFVAEQARAD